MHRLLVSTVVLGLAAVVAAVDATSQGNVAAKVRNGKSRSGGTARSAAVPRSSRDGRRILFTRYRNGNSDVYVVRADGKRLRRLARGPVEDYAADFSPDGRMILFSSDRTGLRQVYVMRLDGSSKRNISRSRSNDWATSWQPVGSR